jgi:hypothetical protein
LILLQDHVELPSSGLPEPPLDHPQEPLHHHECPRIDLSAAGADDVMHAMAAQPNLALP